MTPDERLQLYEKMYFFELERREKIHARFNIPIAILLALFGLLSYMLQHNPSISDGYLIWFWLLFGASVFFIILVVLNFFKYWYGYSDKLMPTPNDIEDFYIKTINYYAKRPGGEKYGEKVFKDFLMKSYREYASVNAKSNDGRSKNLYLATVLIAVSIVFSLLAAIPFYMRQSYQPQKEIEICPLKMHHRHHQAQEMLRTVCHPRINHQFQLQNHLQMPKNGSR